MYGAVRTVSRDDAAVQTRQRTAPLRLLDGGGGRRTDEADSFRRKFENYMRPDPLNRDRRRKAYTAVAAKMARVVYAVVTSGIDYRRFPEATRPGGRIPSWAAVEASATTS